nr:major core protein [Homalodisca vitripennis reovirus]ADN64801.1 major core protein [Homalodisca vitripennis reovirus]
MDLTGTALGGAGDVKSVLLTESSSHFTPVEVYNISEDLKTVKITAVIADKSTVSRVPLPVSFVSAKDVERVFKIIPLRIGSTSMIIDTPRVVFLLMYNESIYDDFMQIKNVPAFEPSVTMHRVEAVFSLMQKYCCSMLDGVPTYSTTVADIPVKAVTMSEFGDRDMDELANYLNTEYEILSAQAQNRALYVRSAAIDVPFPFGDDLNNADVERKNNYHQYRVPFHSLELALYQLAGELLRTQYCHPTVALEFLRRRAPPFLTVEDSVAERMMRAGSGVLMPRPVMELLDYTLVYRSPLALSRLATRLSSKISIKLHMRMVTEVQKTISDMLGVSSSTSTLSTSSIQSLNLIGVENLTLYMARSLLNPNFAYAQISELTGLAFEDFVYGSCLLLIQAMLPPSAILASDRIMINNRLAYFLIRYIAMPATYDRLTANNVVPHYYNHDRWQITTVDYLVAIYTNLLAGERRLNEVIRLYFRGQVPVAVNAINIPAAQTAYKIDERQSISAPYLFGAPINAMAPDTRLLEFKNGLNLPPRSPILPTNIEGANVISLQNLMNKVDVINAIYLSGFGRETPSMWIRNASINTAYLTKLISDVSNLSAIYEAVLANTYANAINVYCDTEYHPEIPLNWKIPYTIKPKDFLFAVFGLIPMYQLSTEAVPDFFAGSEDILILQLIQAVYRMLGQRLGADPTQYFHLEEVLSSISRIVSILTHTSVDVKIYFTDSPHSLTFNKPIWDRFIRRVEQAQLPPLYDIIFQQISNVYTLLQGMQDLLPICDYFYIARNCGWVARGSSESIIAATSIYSNQAVVQSEINSFTDACNLRLRARRVDNVSLTTDLDDMFYNLSSISSDEFVRSDARGRTQLRVAAVPVIKVNMRARYVLNIRTEDGNMLRKPEIKKMMYSDFIDFLMKHQKEPHAPIIEIPITIGLNNIGATTSTAIRSDSKTVDEYFKAYLGAQVVIPMDAIVIEQLGSFDELRNKLSNNVVTRDKTWEIWNDVEASYVPIGNHPVQLDPIGHPAEI